MHIFVLSLSPSLHLRWRSLLHYSNFDAAMSPQCQCFCFHAHRLALCPTPGPLHTLTFLFTPNNNPNCSDSDLDVSPSRSYSLSLSIYLPPSLSLSLVHAKYLSGLVRTKTFHNITWCEQEASTLNRLINITIRQSRRNAPKKLLGASWAFPWAFSFVYTTFLVDTFVARVKFFVAGFVATKLFFVGQSMAC